MLSMAKTFKEKVNETSCGESTVGSEETTLEEAKTQLEAKLAEMEALVKSLQTKLSVHEEAKAAESTLPEITLHNALRRRPHFDGLQEVIPDLPMWLNEAVYRKCDTAKTQKIGKQEGLRAKVIDGRGMNAFGEVAYKVAKHAGVPDKDIQTNTCTLRTHQTIVPTLPGYYRPTKQWDFAVARDGQLVCVVELKSIDDPGRNLNNRIEESIGQGNDFIEMLEHKKIHPDTVWNGYLIIAPLNQKVTHKGTHTYKTTVEQLGIDTECLELTYEERMVFWLRQMQSKRNWTKTGCGLYLKNEERVARNRIRRKGDEQRITVSAIEAETEGEVETLSVAPYIDDLKKGDVVEAWNPNQSQWFGGKIYGIHEDGTIDVTYDLHDLVFDDHNATDVSLLSFFLSMFAFLKKQYGGV